MKPMTAEWVAKAEKDFATLEREAQERAVSLVGWRLGRMGFRLDGEIPCGPCIPWIKIIFNHGTHGAHGKRGHG